MQTPPVWRLVKAGRVRHLGALPGADSLVSLAEVERLPISGAVGTDPPLLAFHRRHCLLSWGSAVQARGGRRQATCFGPDAWSGGPLAACRPAGCCRVVGLINGCCVLSGGLCEFVVDRRDGLVWPSTSSSQADHHLFLVPRFHHCSVLFIPRHHRPPGTASALQYKVLPSLSAPRRPF